MDWINWCRNLEFSWDMLRGWNLSEDQTRLNKKNMISRITSHSLKWRAIRKRTRIEWSTNLYHLISIWEHSINRFSLNYMIRSIWRNLPPNRRVLKIRQIELLWMSQSTKKHTILLIQRRLGRNRFVQVVRFPSWRDQMASQMKMKNEKSINQLTHYIRLQTMNSNWVALMEHHKNAFLVKLQTQKFLQLQSIHS